MEAPLDHRVGDRGDLVLRQLPVPVLGDEGDKGEQTPGEVGPPVAESLSAAS